MNAFFLSLFWALAWGLTPPKGPHYFLVHLNWPTTGQNSLALLGDTQTYTYWHGNSGLLAEENGNWQIKNAQSFCFSVCSTDTHRSARGINWESARRQMLGLTDLQQNGHQGGDWNLSTNTQNNYKYLTGAEIFQPNCLLACLNASGCFLFPSCAISNRGSFVWKWACMCVYVFVVLTEPLGTKQHAKWARCCSFSNDSQ